MLENVDWDNLPDPSTITDTVIQTEYVVAAGKLGRALIAQNKPIPAHVAKFTIALLAAGAKARAEAKPKSKAKKTVSVTTSYSDDDLLNL